MKKRIVLVLVCVLLLAGCAAETTEVTEMTEAAQLANPWVEYATLAEAEAVAGFSLGLPETVAGSYVAETFRVMDGQLLEVVYRDEVFEVTVRKMAGEGQDISGVYTAYDVVNDYEIDGGVCTVKCMKDDADRSWLHLISMNGYSYSLYAPNGYWGDSNADFLGSLYENEEKRAAK